MLVPVLAAPVALYSAGFLARCETLQSPGRTVIAEPGLLGVPAGIEDPRLQLLVTDDQAHDGLAALLPEAKAGMIRVFATAGRCAQLVADRLGWSSDTVSAMVSRELSTIHSPALPSDLTMREVRRSAAGERGGVALEDAVAAAMSAAPTIKGPPEAFAQYLRSLPPTFRLFAAVDGEGQVRATSGHGVFGQYTTVIFVNTDPGWRGRGIGQAMTAHALRAAQRVGARHASLDASEAGRSIYLRLGFESAGTLIRFLSPS